MPESAIYQFITVGLLASTLNIGNTCAADAPPYNVYWGAGDRLFANSHRVTKWHMLTCD